MKQSIWMAALALVWLAGGLWACAPNGRETAATPGAAMTTGAPETGGTRDRPVRGQSGAVAGIRMRGMFSYMADAALLKECLSGKTYPVAMEGDYPALERAYLQSRQTPGSPLLVVLEGHFAFRPDMEGRGTREVIVVDRFGTILPEGRCPPPIAVADLENTRWKLVELDGKKIETAENRQAPHLRLAAEGNRIDGYNGCNHFFGTFEVAGSRLKIKPPLGATLMACPPGVDIDQDFMKALEAVQTYRINGDMLELRDGQGRVRARFQATAL